MATTAAVGHGVDLAGQVSAAAAEMIRVRRDPAVQARKRRRAASRRLKAWSAGAVVSGAVTATGVAAVVDEGWTSGAVGAMVFLVAILLWCIIGIVRASVDLRVRTRALNDAAGAAAGAPGGGRRASGRRSTDSTATRTVCGNWSG